MDELITCGETEIAAANMRITLGKLSRVVQGKNADGFEVQLEVKSTLVIEVVGLAAVLETGFG